MVGGTGTAQVERARTVARPGEGAELVAPRPGELGEAVKEEDEGAVTLLEDVEPSTVGGDETVLPGAVGEDGGAVAQRACFNAATVSWAWTMARSGFGLAAARAFLPTRARMPATSRSAPATMR